MHKIIFIEDEPDLITVVKMRLEANGFQVITACDGEEGVMKVRSEKPDLVLLDIVMPKMDGYHVCSTIKNDPDTKHIPVVIITASGVQNVEQKCFDVGADFVMRKPFESAELVAKIKHFLGEK